MRWLKLNKYLLLSGFVLVPLGLFVLVMLLTFGYGFAVEQSNVAIFVAPLLALQILVFLVCWLFAIRRFREYGNYGSWDVIPIWYFCAVMLVMFLL